MANGTEHPSMCHLYILLVKCVSFARFLTGYFVLNAEFKSSSYILDISNDYFLKL